jgi:Ca2+/Na+ antiporter
MPVPARSAQTLGRMIRRSAMVDQTAFRDACWKLYLEHCTHVRHHEVQRSTVASSILTIATAIIGLVTFDKAISSTDLPLTIFLVLLGCFGAVFSAKQYERASLHTERARHFRDAVDSTLEGKPLKKLKEAADAAHTKDFPRVEKLRINKFWVALYLLLAAIGIVLSIVSAVYPQNAP